VQRTVVWIWDASYRAAATATAPARGDGTNSPTAKIVAASTSTEIGEVGRLLRGIVAMVVLWYEFQKMTPSDFSYFRKPLGLLRCPPPNR